MGRPKKER
jgi:1-acyl-sn-glycerol-3-phosphate acyltransferase